MVGVGNLKFGYGKIVDVFIGNGVIVVFDLLYVVVKLILEYYVGVKGVEVEILVYGY